MTSAEIRQKFLDFFAAPEHGYHKIRPSSSLIPDDPSVLLTSAGMQQFKPYFLGEPSPWGPNVVSVQKCFRTSDIDEVGDERHLTFFEMLGNFSFGGYGKKKAIEYAYEFITKELGLTIDYVTVFEGEGSVPTDEESVKIWRQIDPNLEIKKFGRADNFWGPTGTEGPCGPTTEIYVNGIEIWNLVFNQYYQKADGSLEPLKLFGIDTGMGLERLAMVVQKKSNIFETDLFKNIFPFLWRTNEDDMQSGRIIADHLRASVFLIADGVRPSNKLVGYVLRRLIRKLIFHSRKSLIKENTLWVSDSSLENYVDKIIEEYSNFYHELNDHKSVIKEEIAREMNSFNKALENGLKELDKRYPGVQVQTVERGKGIEPFIVGQRIGRDAVDLHQTYGLPPEIIKELLEKRLYKFDEADFYKAILEEQEKHREISRSGLEKQFAGGLADHEPATIKLHTAHHLLLKALQIVLGKEVKQRGSNITQERLRLDFSWGEKLTDEQKKEVERIVNEKIKADLPVIRTEMAKEEAEKLGAEHEFGAKYPERVSIYSVGPLDDAFSIEFCGGPHVNSTGELDHSTSSGQGPFKIIKEEAVAQGIRRIRAVLV